MQKSVQESKEISIKKTYLKYTRSMRLQLISLVTEQNFSTAEAARIVGIKQTSACRIIASYRKHNRIFERKADRLSRESIQNSHWTQKIDRNHEKIEIKPSQNMQIPKLILSEPDKAEENECGEKMRVPVVDGSSNQFFVVASFPLYFGLGEQREWGSCLLVGNSLPNWGVVYHML